MSVKSLPNRLDVKSVWQQVKRNLPAIPRFQEGYWEAMWPKIQIEGARYGLMGSVGLFSVALMRLTYNASTLIIGFLPYDVHASMGHVTGFASAGALAGGLYKFNQFFYIDPVQVHKIAFALAKRDFWLERKLGGKIRCDSRFSYAAKPAEIVLVDLDLKRTRVPEFMRPYFKEFATKSGSVKLVFEGEAGKVLICCDVEKGLFRDYEVKSMHGKFLENGQVFSFLGNDENCQDPSEFLQQILQEESSGDKASKAPAFRLQLGMRGPSSSFTGVSKY
ncbi:hypothetical protein GUITHDRAFT_133139 [Guillardia theta CCMP2712]|uniref:Uncharacterized protein n=1 Tax=Guillardia theta (strain CCMP2712) TaxID=905079 RepID=L1JXX7_GUITC|nr:hypothetical protein GUITHDRAFT_133139 [Guillardia theta CCMP2712]EKX53421.1 hypothetical protein GUITHDRAFT_133139 [Guillardia theta CCMP2712]|eukprot:XP_005840401.1 hypothetical protein GUITHDRAFT_133139 [Guillardia theta CCMP2712]